MKNKKKIVYVGPFPGEHGGVTIKNELSFCKISERIPLSKVDLTKVKRANPAEIIRLIKTLLGKNTSIILGMSCRRRWFWWLIKILNLFNQKAIKSSILLIMGGVFPSIVEQNTKLRKLVSNFKKIYVETPKMINALENCDLCNVGLYPNCREKPKNNVTPKKNDSNSLKCVFFSMIYPEKGVDTILKVAETLPQCSFDFWGHIDSEYYDTFVSCVNRLQNCNYRGVYSSPEKVYEKLNEYDVLLLPTRMQTEGVPGVLVEAKMSAVPAIVTDIAHNAEIVTNQYDGIVLEEDSYICLERHLRLLIGDEKLMKMKENALKSGEKYFFDYYIDDIVSTLGE